MTKERFADEFKEEVAKQAMEREYTVPDITND